MCVCVSTAGVKLMVDAEQTYLQPAIDHCVQYLQQRYNKDRAVVFNTIQCYLTDSRCVCRHSLMRMCMPHSKCCFLCVRRSRLELSLRRARRHGVKYGVKLVRGAYLVQESALAAERGYPNPIWPRIQDTHANYNACAGLLLKQLDRAEVATLSQCVCSGVCLVT